MSESDVTDEASERSFASHFAAVGCCFLLSGFAALLYETVWLRQFSINFGTSEQSLAIVLGTYMGGLALGSILASRYAGSMKRPLLVYGLLELGIAITALAVPFFLMLVRSIQVHFFAGADAPPPAGEMSQVVFSFLGATLATILPTTMMGATLPMLAKHVVKEDRHLGGRIGALYAINTLGAVVGTLTAAYVLLPSLGLRKTIYVGAAANVAVFVIVWWMARRVDLRGVDLRSVDFSSGDRSDAKSESNKLATNRDLADATESKSVSDEDSESVVASLRKGIVWIMALSSGVSFVYEILFTRMIGHLLGGSVFAFASMLAAFLSGIAIGGAIASRLASDRVRSAQRFMIAQCATAVLALIAFVLLNLLAAQINDAVLRYESQLIPRELFAMLILFLPALAIGLTFPFAIRVHARNSGDAASSSAIIYAASTLGGVTGAFATGTFLLPMLGYRWVLLAGILMNLSIAAWIWSLGKFRAPLLVGVIATGVACLFFLPAKPDQLLRVSSFENLMRTGALVYDHTGRSSTVTMHNVAGSFELSNNGLPEAGAFPRGSLREPTSTATWLGLLPALLRPDAEEMLIVGFGSGQAVTGTPQSVRHIDVFELEPSVIEANQLVAQQRYDNPFADSRMRIILNDGRSGLALTEKKYDLIVSQPSHPWTAGASHLYTLEFANLVKEHLTEDGLFLLWMNNQFADLDVFLSLSATMTEAFPHTAVFRPDESTPLFVGALNPITIPTSPPASSSASDQKLFRQMGVQLPGSLHALLALDDAGLRALCSDAHPTTDENNLLALRRIPYEDQSDNILSIDRKIKQYDPMLNRKLEPPSEDSEMDWKSIVYRRMIMNLFRDTDQLINQLPRLADQELLIAIVESVQQNVDESQVHLQAAINLDPDLQEAWVLQFVQNSESTEDDLQLVREKVEMPLLAIAEASLAIRSGKFDRMKQLDAELAKVPASSVLYAQAGLTRIIWRDLDQGAGSVQKRGSEMLKIIEQCNGFVPRPDLLMLRLKAAAYAQQAVVAVTTAKMVADLTSKEIAEQRRLEKNGGDLGEPINVAEHQVRLINALNVVNSMESNPRVDRNRLYGVRLVIEDQLAKLERFSQATETDQF